MLAYFALTIAGEVHYNTIEPVFWPANGIFTLLFLIASPRERWICGGIAYATHASIHVFVENDPLDDSLMIPLSVLLEGILVAATSRRWCGPAPDFSRLYTLCRFTLLCALPVVTVLDFGFGLIRRIFLAYPVWDTVSGWISVDFFGIMMVVPALHTIMVPRYAGLPQPSRSEQLVLFALLLAGDVALFGFSSAPALFIVFPILVGISFRLGLRGAAQALIMTGLAAFIATILGAGPFAAFHHAGSDGLLLQIFVLATVFTVLPAAGAVAERQRAQQQLQAVHRELVDASRLAGRAEVATNILHNVGNVLNSVNVSANLAADLVKTSHTASLQRLVGLLESRDWATFAVSEQGRGLPTYLTELAKQLNHEQKTVATELKVLQDNVSHINHIVAAQQSYARRTAVVEPVDLEALVEDSLQISGRELSAQGIQLVREFTTIARPLTDKHKVLEVLVNLISNARNACNESQTVHKQITIKITATATHATVSVTDNGVGISAENKARLFSHGFTTRPTGHGYGLHSSALAAKELGGCLTADSAGLGYGATFTLELPFNSTDAAPLEDGEGMQASVES